MDDAPLEDPKFSGDVGAIVLPGRKDLLTADFMS